MRDPIEILRDMEAATQCARHGKPHRFTRCGEPYPVFYDGKVRGSFMQQDVVCKRCGFKKSREAVALLEKMP